MIGSISRRSILCLAIVCAAVLACVLLTACAPGHNPARATADSLIILNTASYQEEENVRLKIRRECELEWLVPEKVNKYASGDYDNIYFTDGVPPTTPAKVLSMKIIDAKGQGGGRRSGAKSITIEGTLTQKGNVVGSFIASRTTVTGGWHGGSKGTCALLERCAKRLGKDIGAWLEKPSLNATLGTAKVREKQGAVLEAEEEKD